MARATSKASTQSRLTPLSRNEIRIALRMPVEDRQNDAVTAAKELRFEEAAYLRDKIKELSLKKNVLVGAIIRKSRCIIPGGGDSIEEGDSVIVISADMGLRELDSICREE